MKNLNIGILVISDGWGGAEESVYHLAKQLLKHHVKISLFVNDELIGEYHDIKGISLFPLGPMNQKNKITILYSHCKMRQKLIKILKTKQLDLIHLHLEGSFQVYFGLIHKFKIPLVLTLHGSEIVNYSTRKSFLDYKALHDLLIAAKVVISPSVWQIKKLPKEFKQKIVIIPNGIDTKAFKPIKIKKTTRIILFVGRLISLKGIYELIEVARQLPAYEFWFSGQGPLVNNINLKNTKYLGFKTRNELIRLYNKATICCFPSHYENMPIVGLEALACGAPVIATKLGFSEYIKNNQNGILIEAKNLKQLKKSIILLMKTPQLRMRLEKDGRKTARQFDWNLIATKYVNLYQNLVIKA